VTARSLLLVERPMSPDDTSNRIRRSALFVDFDNVYLGLSRLDPSAAESFATSPGSWLTWLTRTPLGSVDEAAGSDRRCLIRKCYLNPVVFWGWRSAFVQAGFQVVDCPPLAKGKNAADIQMAVDILDALSHPTHLDEFIILSGDSDFTPILHRLRAHDRETVILAVGSISAAYRAAADLVLTEEQFVQAGWRYGQAQPSSASPTRDADAVDGHPTLDPTADWDELRSEIDSQIRAMVRDAIRPISAPAVSSALNTRSGGRLRESKWVGRGGFKELVEALPRQGYVVLWEGPGRDRFLDPDRHDLALAQERSPSSLAAVHPRLPALAARVVELTGAPMLTPSEYALLFRSISMAVSEEGYSLLQSTNTVQARATLEGLTVTKPEVSFVLKSLAYASDAIAGGTSLPASQLAALFAQGIVIYCERVELALVESDKALIFTWIANDRGTAVDDTPTRSHAPMLADTSMGRVDGQIPDRPVGSAPSSIGPGGFTKHVVAAVGAVEATTLEALVLRFRGLASWALTDTQLTDAANGPGIPLTQLGVWLRAVVGQSGRGLLDAIGAVSFLRYACVDTQVMLVRVQENDVRLVTRSRIAPTPGSIILDSDLADVYHAVGERGAPLICSDLLEPMARIMNAADGGDAPTFRLVDMTSNGEELRNEVSTLVRAGTSLIHLGFLTKHDVLPLASAAFATVSPPPGAPLEDVARQAFRVKLERVFEQPDAGELDRSFDPSVRWHQ
jgi:NYN domain